MSEHVEVAREIRAHLKQKGIKGKVRSSHKGLTSRVDVDVQDMNPSDYHALKCYLNDFRWYPHETLERHTPPRDESMPKVGALFVSIDFSASLYQEAMDYITTTIGSPAHTLDMDNLGLVLDIPDNEGEPIGAVLRRVLLGGRSYHTFCFWGACAAL